MKKQAAALCAAALLGAFAAPAWATNGMNMIGYGTRAIGMGGADVALGGDAAAVGGNPAAITTAAPRSATVQATALMPELNYQDPANDVDGENQLFLMPMLGYAHRLANSPLSLGIGVYAQGGMGVDFQDVLTQAGTSDEMTSKVAFLRVNPILAYQVNDAVSLGASLMVGYAMAEFTMFPNTPGMGSGLDVQDLASMGYAGRVGALVKLGEQVRLGLSYTTESTVELEDGTATLNFGPQGGFVAYDAALEDFSWPQELEVGVAFLPLPGLTVAADVKWINWSATIDQPTLKLSNPDSEMAPSTMEIPFDMGWDDQIVYALGVEYLVGGKHAFRAGVNYGKNPVPDDKLNPLFPAIPETHMTLGYGLSFGQWTLDLAWEHAFEKTQKSSAMPIEVAHSQNTLSAGLSYRY